MIWRALGFLGQCALVAGAIAVAGALLFVVLPALTLAECPGCPPASGPAAAASPPSVPSVQPSFVPELKPMGETK